VAVSGILAFSVATNDQKGNSYHSLPVRVTRAVAEVESYRPKLELVEVSQVFATGTDSVVTALQPIDLAVPPGKFVSIIGPSGCGKSTLFNIIAGLQRPTAGDVLLDGQVVTRMIGLVGYMLQKDLLLPWRTVLDNVILGMELKGVAKTTARAPSSRSSVATAGRNNISLGRQVEAFEFDASNLQPDTRHLKLILWNRYTNFFITSKTTLIPKTSSSF